MPSSTIQTFSDPDEYTAAIRGTTAELRVTERGDFAAEIVRIELHRMVVTRLRDNLPRVFHNHNFPGRAGISFRTEPGPRFLMRGVEMEPTTLNRVSENYEAHQHSSGPASLGVISLPVEEMSSVGGYDLSPPRETLSVTPAPAAMARLQRLHAAAVQLAETAPEIIAIPDAARGLEQALGEAMAACLDTGDPAHVRVAHRHHAMVMRRLDEVLQAETEGSLYLADLCKAVGCSPQTLRACCREHLGMSPKRYLLLRRMHFARRALRRANLERTTVTEIATNCGFWELGRFSVAYRSLFGEAPLATLRRPPDDMSHGESSSPREFVKSA